MSILSGFRLSRLFLVILLSLVFLTTIPPKGSCDDWVKIGDTEDYTVYYNSSSVKIDKQNKIINVLIKHVYTEKGKQNMLDKFKNHINVAPYKDINYSQIFFLINYHELKGCINHIIHYSKSRKVLDDTTFPDNWRNIPSDSLVNTVLNKILNEYNIKR